MTGNPRIERKKSHGFRFRFSLKAIHWPETVQRCPNEVRCASQSRRFAEHGECLLASTEDPHGNFGGLSHDRSVCMPYQWFAIYHQYSPVLLAYIIYDNIYHQYSPVLLAYIPYIRILWVWFSTTCSNYDLKGSMGLSKAGPDTNGSQFFITTAAAHHLDGMETQELQVTWCYHHVNSPNPCGKSLVDRGSQLASQLDDVGWLLVIPANVWWNWGCCLFLAFAHDPVWGRVRWYDLLGHRFPGEFSESKRCVKKRWSTESFHVLTRRRYDQTRYVQMMIMMLVNFLQTCWLSIRSYLGWLRLTHIFWGWV